MLIAVELADDRVRFHGITDGHDLDAILDRLDPAEAGRLRLEPLPRP